MRCIQTKTAPRGEDVVIRKGIKFKLVIVSVLCAFASSIVNAEQRELVINTDTSDPAPKAAFEQLIKDFEAAHPDVKVKWNLFDHEGYKTAIRNFLSDGTFC